MVDETVESRVSGSGIPDSGRCRTGLALLLAPAVCQERILGSVA